MSEPGSPSWSRQVAAFAVHPGFVEQLLAEHVDDGAGRCSSPTCTTSGGYSRARWPCGMSQLADAAVDLIRSRRRT
ncbi:hypothetical protein [Pseudonocardia kongjuensis]|uniref:hypothetical protein n=1 Tax=Pseudonocardia kongjuensis TaxID=102227 RepID=UPI0031CF5D71